MLIFLDFDGVLHPKGAGQRHFTRLPVLENFLRGPALKPAKLVISSSWREAYSFNKLRSVFSADIAERLVGMTPVLDEHTSDYHRGEEIEAWLSRKSETPWIALDDEIENFAPRLRHCIVLVDGKFGIQESDLERAKQMLLAA